MTYIVGNSADHTTAGSTVTAVVNTTGRWGRVQGIDVVERFRENTCGGIPVGIGLEISEGFKAVGHWDIPMMQRKQGSLHLCLPR